MSKLWDLLVIWMGFYASSSLLDCILDLEKWQWKTTTAMMNGVFDGIFLLMLLHMAVFLRVYGDGRLVWWDISKSPKLLSWMMSITWSIGALSVVNGFGVIFIRLTWNTPETALTVLTLMVKLYKIRILIAIIARIVLQDHEEPIVGVPDNRASPDDIYFKTVLPAQVSWCLLLAIMTIDIRLPLFSPHQQLILRALRDTKEIAFCVVYGVIVISEFFRPNPRRL